MIVVVNPLKQIQSRDASQFTNSEKQSAGPSELFAEPVFTRRLPVAKKRNQNAFRVPILMYHHIGFNSDSTDKIRDDLTVPTDQFEKQVAWISSRGYHSVTLNDVFLHAQNKRNLPPQPIVFTFDDGYDDTFTNAVPVLRKYGFIGSFAIITQWPGTSVGSNNYATWNQIKLAHDAGMEIVSHTQNHFDGTSPKFSRGYILQDLKGSIMDLKQRLGFETDILVYPYGHYNEQYVSAAKEDGFSMGVTVHEGATINPDDLMEVPRIRVHGHETLMDFENILLGANRIIK